MIFCLLVILLYKPTPKWLTRFFFQCHRNPKLIQIHLALHTKRQCHYQMTLKQYHRSLLQFYWARSKSGPARGGSGIPIYPLFCPQDTNIPQNRKMCDTKYLKLFWNRILNTWKWTSQILIKEKFLIHCPLPLPLRSANIHGDIFGKLQHTYHHHHHHHHHHLYLKTR